MMKLGTSVSEPSSSGPRVTACGVGPSLDDAVDRETGVAERVDGRCQRSSPELLSDLNVGLAPRVGHELWFGQIGDDEPPPPAAPLGHRLDHAGTQVHADDVGALIEQPRALGAGTAAGVQHRRPGQRSRNQCAHGRPFQATVERPIVGGRRPHRCQPVLGIRVFEACSASSYSGSVTTPGSQAQPFRSATVYRT